MILTSFLREAYVEKSRTWKPAVAREQWLRLRASAEALEQATPDYPSLVREGNFDWDLGITDHTNRFFDFLGEGVCDILTWFPSLLHELPEHARHKLALIGGLTHSQSYANRCCEILAMTPESISADERPKRLEEMFDPLR